MGISVFLCFTKVLKIPSQSGGGAADIKQDTWVELEFVLVREFDFSYSVAAGGERFLQVPTR